MPKLDLKRLAEDVDTLRRSRPAGLGPGGRRLTGSMAIVRDNLDALEALKAGGSSWVDIAAGLAAQGVTQGEGDPITGKRLTALISSVKREVAKEAAKQEAAQARRARRPDLRQAPATPSRRLRLASDLTSKPLTPPESSAASEQAIRQAQLDGLQDLIRKD